MSLASAFISLHFNPITDSLEEVQGRVQMLFDTFGGDEAAAGGATPQDGAGVPQIAQIDAAGLPWDARIHSTPATITKTSGKWRAKKNVDAALVAQVEAELRATTQQLAQDAATTAALTQQVAAAMQMPAPGQQPAMQMPAMQMPAAPVVPNHYQDLIALLGPRMNTPQNPAGNLDDAWVSQCLGMLQVDPPVLQSVAALPADRQQYILAQFKATLGA